MNKLPCLINVISDASGKALITSSKEFAVAVGFVLIANSGTDFWQEVANKPINANENADNKLFFFMFQSIY